MHVALPILHILHATRPRPLARHLERSSGHVHSNYLAAPSQPLCNGDRGLAGAARQVEHLHSRHNAGRLHNRLGYRRAHLRRLRPEALAIALSIRARLACASALAGAHCLTNIAEPT